MYRNIQNNKMLTTQSQNKGFLHASKQSVKNPTSININIIRNSQQNKVTKNSKFSQKRTNSINYSTNNKELQHEDKNQDNLNDSHNTKLINLTTSKIQKSSNKFSILINKSNKQINKQNNQQIIYKQRKKKQNYQRYSQLPKLVVSSQQKKRLSFYYYISQIQRDIKYSCQQNQSLFLNHLLFSMYIYRSHKYTYPSTIPHIKVKVPALEGTDQQIKKSNNPKAALKKKKVIIFDLDETLVHSISQSTTEGKNQAGQYQIKVLLKSQSKKNIQQINDNNTEPTEEELDLRFSNKIKKLTKKMQKLDHKIEDRNKNQDYFAIYNLNLRPYAKDVLKRLSQNFILGIFTAAEQAYANQVLKILDINNNLFSFKLYKQHCTVLSSDPMVNQQRVKDLRVISPIDLSQTILVDNSPLSYLFQHQNGIPIVPFTTQVQDDQLLKLQSFLNRYFLDCDDVRKIIKPYFRTKDYEKCQNAKEVVEKLFKFKDFI